MTKTYFIGHNLIELDVVDSTNNYAANLLLKSKVADGTVIMSYFQSNGKGQRGEEWHSEPGSNLLFSIILSCSFIHSGNYFLLSKAVAIGINEVIEQETGKISFVKWPNDIYIDHKKIAGILIENQWKGHLLENAIIGIGINVNQVDFDKLTEATSLRLITGKDFIIKDILKRVLIKIEDIVNELIKGETDDLEKRYFDHLLYGDEWKMYRLNNGDIIEGKIIKVMSNGLLVIKLKNDIERTFDFKEITFIL